MPDGNIAGLNDKNTGSVKKQDQAGDLKQLETNSQVFSYKGKNTARMALRSWIYRAIFLLCIVLFAIPANLQAQKRKRSYNSSSIYLAPQFFVLKDANIYGHAFRGPGFALGYHQVKQSIYGFSRYEAAFAAGAAMGGETMGLNLHFKPLDLAGGWPIIDETDLSLYLGAYVAMNYYLQVFTELEDGHVFWSTFIDAGPRMILDLNGKNQKFRFQLANSVGGLASRPDGLENTYYHDLHAFDILSNMHSNLQAGSFNILNHTDLEVEWRHLNKMGTSIAYRLEYFGYYQGARLDYLVNSVSIRIIVGGEPK